MTLESDNPFLAVRQSPPTGGDASYIEYRIELSKEIPVGVSNATLRFSAKSDAKQTAPDIRLSSLRVPVSAAVEGDIQAKPMAVIFTTADADDRAPNQSPSRKVVLSDWVRPPFA